jgi:glycosyltransferase involved in cell wall biosynthesis
LIFTIITPCRNAGARLRETMESVVSQTALKRGSVDLQYLVVDGASTDNTLEVARSFSHPGLEVISEPDNGVYDALAKGLKRARGNIIAYLNAGDYYHKTAFAVVAEVFTHPNVKWLTGFRVAYNDHSQVIQVRDQRPFRCEFFENGFYGGRPYPTVQQESTFWSSELMGAVDLTKLASFKLAGDFYLWQTFARHLQVASVDAHLGGYRIHAGQLSEQQDEYDQEVRTICRKATPRERLTAWCDLRAGAWTKKLLRPFCLPPMNGDGFYYHTGNGRWQIYS